MSVARTRCRLGIDFDNTLVQYDALLHREARQRGLIPPRMMVCKREIRDWIRRLPEGEREWQRLQALMYGTKIKEARPAPGLAKFFACCKRHTAEVFIVSHKTRFAALDSSTSSTAPPARSGVPGRAGQGPVLGSCSGVHLVPSTVLGARQGRGTTTLEPPRLGGVGLHEPAIDLREAAMAWMRAHRFFDVDGFGLFPQHVYFESTRAEKITRIGRLGCTHFIDDLEETFLEPGFPQGIQKILYATAGHPRRLPDVRVVTSWQDMTEGLFDEGP